MASPVPSVHFPEEIWIFIIKLLEINLQAEVLDDFQRIGNFEALSRKAPYDRRRAQLANSARIVAKARQDDAFTFLKNLSRISKYYGGYPSHRLLLTFRVSLAQQPVDMILSSQRLKYLTRCVIIVHDRHEYPPDEELDLVCQGLVSLTQLQELDMGKLCGPQSSGLGSKILQRLVCHGNGLLPNLRHFIWCNINNEPIPTTLLDFLSAHPHIRSVSLLNYTPRTRLVDYPWTIQSCPFTERVESDRAFLPSLESFCGNILIGTRLCRERATICRLKCTATRTDRREWANLASFPSVQVQCSSSTGFDTPAMEVENAQLRLVHQAVRAVARCEFAKEEEDEFISILQSFQDLVAISIRATLYYISWRSRQDLVLRIIAACPSIKQIRFTELTAIHKRYAVTGSARWEWETKIYSGWMDVEWAEWAFYRELRASTNE